MTDLGKGHREYEVVSTLTHIPTGDVFGQGVGCCSTMESKYRWRGGSRLCPECGKPTIKKSKYPPRNAPRDTPPGFYCFGKLGGCGVEFAHDDKRIVGQSEERQENPDIADTYNTVLKMAKKRAQIDATLTATGASDIFAQDLEDLAGKGAFDAVNGVATPDSAPSEAPPPSDDIPLAAEAGSAIGKPVSWKDVKENVLGYLNLADTKARAAADLRAACDRLKISRPSVKDITPDEWTALNKELPAPLKVDF
jgi:hypothetical protein